MIVNIVYDNNTYVPVEPTKYTKRYKHKILGSVPYNEINNYLQTDLSCDDISTIFNNEYNYMKYVTKLIIQALIYHIKTDTDTDDYYTTDNSDYVI